MMLPPEFEERRLRARRALDAATSGNVVDEYRAELYKLRDTLGINRPSGSYLPEGVGSNRSVVRAAIETVIRERNETEALLLSFTSVSGYEAVETFNRRKYKGHDDWELRGGRVARCGGDFAGEGLTVLEAVDIAGLLRREEHVARNAVSP